SRTRRPRPRCALIRTDSSCGRTVRAGGARNWPPPGSPWWWPIEIVRDLRAVAFDLRLVRAGALRAWFEDVHVHLLSITHVHGVDVDDRPSQTGGLLRGVELAGLGDGVEHRLAWHRVAGEAVGVQRRPHA